MIDGPWELTAEKTDWRGVPLYQARTTDGREFLLEDLAIASPIKDRFYREVVVKLEEEIGRASTVVHPALRRPAGVTRHGDRYLLVRPMDADLWDGWGAAPKPRDPVELGQWVQTMSEVLAAYHQAGMLTRGIARSDLVASTAAGLLVRDPLCEGLLATYRDRERCGRNDLAPEVSRGEAWGKPADVFALGLNAYQLAADRFPLSGTGPVLYDNLLAEKIADPRAFVPELGAPLAGSLLSLLERSPKQRPSAAMAAVELAAEGRAGQWVATEQERERFAGAGQRRARLFARRERLLGVLRRNRVVLIGAAAAIVVLVLLTGLRGRPPAPVITGATSPGQVVAALYRAVAELDQTLLDETLAPKAGKEIKQIVLMVFVIDRATKAEGAKPLGSPSPLSVRGLQVTRVRQEPPEFVARYELVLRKGMGKDTQEEISTVEDRLVLERVRDRRVGRKWVVTRLDHKQSALRTIKTPMKEEKPDTLLAPPAES